MLASLPNPCSKPADADWNRTIVLKLNFLPTSAKMQDRILSSLEEHDKI